MLTDGSQHISGVRRIQHGNKGRIAYTLLAQQIEITVSQCNCHHCILVGWNLLRARMLSDFLEQSFILLEVASTYIETYDAHEYILVVGQVGHRPDILDVGMLVKKGIYSDYNCMY